MVLFFSEFALFFEKFSLFLGKFALFLEKFKLFFGKGVIFHQKTMVLWNKSCVIFTFWYFAKAVDILLFIFNNFFMLSFLCFQKTCKSLRNYTWMAHVVKTRKMLRFIAICHLKSAFQEVNRLARSWILSLHHLS